MKAIILFLLTLNCYAAFIEFDHHAAAGGGGGGAVDSVFGRSGDVTAFPGDYSASLITNTPSGDIISTDVQNAINELDTEKLASTDSDGDTKIQVEENGADEDKIRFDTAANERMIIDENGAIGVGTSAPASTSILDITSTEKGVLVPRMTTLQRTTNITAPIESLLVYDTDLQAYLYYDAAQTVWRVLGRDSYDLDGNTGIVLDSNADEDKIRFNTAGAEAVIIDDAGSVGIGTSAPAATAALDITSTTKGAVLPRMTTVQREAIAATVGLIVYDTDLSRYYYNDGVSWFPLDNGIGHGALGPYSFSITNGGADISLDAETQFNFQRVNPTTGAIENALVTIPANTVVSTFTKVGANDIKYVSAKYDWDLQDVSYEQNLNPNNVNIGTEILLTGPFTDGSVILGAVSFYHYATDSTVGWSDDLANVERARVIEGMQMSFSIPTYGGAPVDGSEYELTMASGVTFNSLLRDPAGHISDFLAASTDNNVIATPPAYEVYKYRPGVADYIYVPENTAPAAIKVGEYWDGAAIQTASSQQFTVTAIFAYPGSPNNQFFATLLDDTFHANMGDAKNAIFSGEVLDGKPAGLDSAALVGYLIIQGFDESHHNNFDPNSKGDNGTWDIIGPRDVVSLTTTASGSALPIDDLSDVTVTTPADGEILKYNSTSTQWENVLEITSWKEPVKYATTAALPTFGGSGTGTLTLTGLLNWSPDGVAVVDGDRVLVKDNTASPDNGIYVVSGVGVGVVLTRTADANTSAEVLAGLTVRVEAGTANADKVFYLTTDNPITLETTALTFITKPDPILIVDADGDTRVQVEETADEDIIRFDIGENPANTGVEVGKWSRTYFDVLSDVVTIDPTATEATGFIGGDAFASLTVNRYRDGQGIRKHSVFNVDHTQDSTSGNRVNGIGAYLEFNGTNPGIELGDQDFETARLNWLTPTGAGDDILAEGQIRFDINSDQDNLPRPVLEINPHNLTVRGLRDGSDVNGVSAASLTLQDSDNTQSVTISAASNITTANGYTLTLPTTEPPASGQLLQSDSGGNLSWITTPAGSGEAFNPANSFLIQSHPGPWFDIIYNGNYIVLGGNPAVATALPYGFDGGENFDINTGPLKLLPAAGADSTYGSGDPFPENAAGLGGAQRSLAGAFTKFRNTGHMQIGLTSDGEIYTMGSNVVGAIGDCSNTQRDTPYKLGSSASCDTTSNGAQGAVIPDAWKDFGVVWTNNYGTGNSISICAISSIDELWCWGSNVEGVLGTENNTNYNYPRKILNYRDENDTTVAFNFAGGDRILKIVDGTFNTDNDAFGDTNFAFIVNLVASGGVNRDTILISGKNSWGEIGDNTNTYRNIFTMPASPTGTFDPGTLDANNQDVVDLWRHGSGPGGFCAIVEDADVNDRRVYCWGYGAGGQNGNGTNSNLNAPVAATIPGFNYAIEGKGYVGAYTASANCVRAATAFGSSDIRIWCWGNGASGQLGNGASVASNEPVELSFNTTVGTRPIARDFWLTQQSTGNNDNAVMGCGTFEDAAVSGTYRTYCWGNNLSNVIASGSGVKNVPVLQKTLSGVNIQDMFCKGASNDPTCLALDDTGGLWCSGNVSNSRCGINLGTRNRNFFKLNLRNKILE